MNGNVELVLTLAAVIVSLGALAVSLRVRRTSSGEKLTELFVSVNSLALASDENLHAFDRLLYPELAGESLESKRLRWAAYSILSVAETAFTNRRQRALDGQVVGPVMENTLGRVLQAPEGVLALTHGGFDKRFIAHANRLRQGHTMNTVRMTAGVAPGDRFETVRYPADEILLRVAGGGNVQVVEYRSTDREGPPAHYHPWDEIEYVIEGEVEFRVAGEWVRGGPGTVQMLPAGASHSVRVPEGEARLLMITIGAPFDGFSRDLASLYAGGSATPQSVVAVANRHGVRLDGDRPEPA